VLAALREWRAAARTEHDPAAGAQPTLPGNEQEKRHDKDRG
jgi:hypothetical protein